LTTLSHPVILTPRGGTKSGFLASFSQIKAAVEKKPGPEIKIIDWTH